MFKWIDRSRFLSRLLESLSSTLAAKRGLLTVLGIGLVIISFVIHLVNLASPQPVLDLAWSITHHLGIIVAFIGLLLVEPLGG